MKKLNFLLFLIIGYFWVVSPAQAFIYIEPVVGYNIKGMVKQDPNIEYEYDGLLYGGKIGAHFSGVFLGGLYEKSPFQLVQTKPSYYLPADETKQNRENTYIGAFVGVNLPVMFRFWASYFISAKSEVAKDPNKGDVVSGSGYSLGVGFTGMPFVSFNAEYRLFSLGKFFDKSAASNTTLTYPLKVNEILISVSLPLKL